MPHSSASPGEIHESVVPLPDRIEIPGGMLSTVQANGAMPPPETDTPMSHGTPNVQSSKAYAATVGSAAGSLMTSIDMLLV